jgi:tripartite-type tricarboxylate transporter receptor subunit TctC
VQLILKKRNPLCDKRNDTGGAHQYDSGATMRFLRPVVCLPACAIVFAGACVAAGPTPAFPVKPMRLLVGVAPGGGTNFAARLIGARLSERFGQPVITDNRTGATGNIALELTAKAPADGYTLVVFNLGHLTSALLSRSARIDAARDFAAVSQIASGTLMLGLHAGLPARTLKDFIAYA